MISINLIRKHITVRNWFLLAIAWYVGGYYLSGHINITFQFVDAPIYIGIVLFFLKKYLTKRIITADIKRFQNSGYSTDWITRGKGGMALCADFKKKKIMLIDPDLKPYIIDRSAISYMKTGGDGSKGSRMYMDIKNTSYSWFEICYPDRGTAETVLSQIKAI